jgi:hypothetical protein
MEIQCDVHGFRLACHDWPETFGKCCCRDLEACQGAAVHRASFGSVQSGACHERTSLQTTRRVRSDVGATSIKPVLWLRIVRSSAIWGP